MYSNILLLKSRKIFIFCVFIFATNSYSGEKAIKKISESYQFIFSEKDSILIDQLIEKTRASIKKIDHFFLNRKNFITTIYLVSSEEEFISYLGNRMPEWAQAVALTSQNTVVIKKVSAEDVRQLPRILLHEIVHIKIANVVVTKSIPVWLHEGLAQYFSYEDFTFNDNITLSVALQTNRIISLDGLDSLNTFNTKKAQLGYLLAHSAGRFFVREYDEEKLYNLLQSLENYTFNEAFSLITNNDLIDFEFQWYEYLEENYKWYILFNFVNLYWIAGLVLFLFAYMRIKLRNRKKIKNWDDEEPLNNLV